jgi:uncharacterized cupredoxin-like copper-binding protein
MRIVAAGGLLALAGWMAGVSIGSSRTLAESPWQSVEIRADEYSFTPNQIRAKARRPLELIVANGGHEPHQFQSSLFRNQVITVEFGENSVRGKGIEIVNIAAGATVRIKLLSPPPGEFDFQCRIPSHHGMDGIIRIESDRNSTLP